MNPYIIFPALIVALVVAAPFLAHAYRSAGVTGAFNIAEGSHKNSDTRFAEEAIATKFLLVKKGAAALGVLINGAADLPEGVCTDNPASGEECDVTFLGARNETVLMIPSEALGEGVEVFTAAAGKIQDEPAVAGTFYKVGVTKRVGVANEPVEVDPCVPQKLVVAAAPANVAAIAAAMNGAALVKFLP